MKAELICSLFNLLPNFGTLERQKYLVLRLAGLNIENDVIMRSPIEIGPRSHRNVTIRSGSFINSGCPPNYR